MTVFDPELQHLVEQNQGLVRSLAATIHRKLPPHVELDDVIAYGQVGLMEAARDFDPSRGNRFSTYAYYRIRGAIYDGLAQMAWFSRSQYQSARYELMSGAVLQQNQDETAADHEYMVPAAPPSPEAELRWLRDLSGKLAVVSLLTHAGGSSQSREISLTDSGRFAPPTLAINVEIKEKLEGLIAALPDDERTVIRATYFDGLTLQDAGRTLSISKSWATRLHAKALRRLARSLKLLGLACHE